MLESWLVWNDGGGLKSDWIRLENMFTSNASSFEYKTLALAAQKKSIVFQASSPADIHVALGDDARLGATSYEIVLGGEDNMQTWISARKNGSLPLVSRSHGPQTITLKESPKESPERIPWNASTVGK